MIPANQVAKLRNAVPFWASLLLVPVAWFSAVQGGLMVILLPLCTWYLFAILDAFLGLNTENADLETTEDQLTWYKLITLVWAPIQFCVLFGMIWYATGPGDAHLNPLETILLFFGVGTALAGVAGVIAGPVLGTFPGMAFVLGSIVFVTIVIGGLGSLWGALVASLLIGWITTFAKAYNLAMSDVLNAIGIATPDNLDDNIFRDLWTVTSPQIADILPYILMVLILIFRPYGLFGNRDA